MGLLLYLRMNNYIYNIEEKERSYTLGIIDIPFKSYFLGWMYSDGGVYHNKTAYSYSTKLNINDKEILELFQPIFENKPIKTEKNSKSYYLVSYSRSLFFDLIKNGCLEDKSYSNENIINLPNLDINLMKYFIRGFFDGDGWYYINPKKPNLIECCIANRNENLLNQLSIWLKNTLNIDCELKFRKNSHRGLFWLRIRKKENAKKFCEYIGKDHLELSLKRKMDKIHQFLNNYKSNTEVRRYACNVRWKKEKNK